MNLAALTRTEYTKHMLSCKKCGTISWQQRHEAVNNMLHKTLKYNGMTSVCNPRDFPLPGNSRGGPDQVITFQAQNIALDVAVTENDPETTFKVKMNKYEDFSLAHNFSILPFVTTIQGTLCHRTLSLLKQFWYYPFPDTLFRESLLLNFQFALVRGLKSGIDRFHIQNQNTSFPTLSPSLAPSSLATPHLTPSDLLPSLPSTTSSSPVMRDEELLSPTV